MKLLLEKLKNIPPNHKFNVSDYSTADADALTTMLLRWWNEESFDRTCNFIFENISFDSHCVDELEEFCNNGLENLIQTYSNKENVQPLIDFQSNLQKQIQIFREPSPPITITQEVIEDNNNTTTTTTFYEMKRVCSDAALQLLLKF